MYLKFVSSNRSFIFVKEDLARLEKKLSGAHSGL